MAVIRWQLGERANSTYLRTLLLVQTKYLKQRFRGENQGVLRDSEQRRHLFTARRLAVLLQELIHFRLGGYICLMGVYLRLVRLDASGLGAIVGPRKYPTLKHHVDLVAFVDNLSLVTPVLSVFILGRWSVSTWDTSVLVVL